MHKSHRPVKSFRDLISRWPNTAEFGRDISVPYETARKMKDRDSIADVHWTAVVAAGKRRGIRVTLEDLARLKAGKSVRPPSDRVAA